MTNCPIHYTHRSTIVHSNTVPPKDQHNYASFKDRQNAEEAYKNSKDTEAVHVNIARSMQAPQRIPLGTFSRYIFEVPFFLDFV